MITDPVNPDDSKAEVSLLREKINTNLKGVCLKHLAAGKDNELTLTSFNNFHLTFQILVSKLLLRDHFALLCSV